MLAESTLAIVNNVMGAVGAVLASVMFLSSIPVMRCIVKNKGVGEYSGFPYMVQTCNCALWSTYSITYWQGGKMFWPLLTNGLGLVIASVSFFVYVLYCGGAARLSLLPLYGPPLFATTAFCVYALITMTSGIATVAGVLCLFINMIMYLGPCAGMKAAIASQSTAFLPLSLGISTITCSLPWLFFGLAISNLTMWLPNACGLLFGSLQVLTYAWLSRKSTSTAEACGSCISGVDADGNPRPQVQNFATSGDIFSFLTTKVEAKTLRAVQTWGGTPLFLAGAEEEIEKPRPRANSAPSPPVTPKIVTVTTTQPNGNPAPAADSVV